MFKIIILLLIAVHKAEFANILAVFPFPGISHQVVLTKIPLELSKRGHSVIVLTTNPVYTNTNTPTNYTELDLQKISYEIWHEGFVKNINGRGYDPSRMLRQAFKVIAEIFAKQWQSDTVQNAIKDKKFDLILTEACVRTSLVLSHHFKAPAVQLSSFGATSDNLINIGAPTHPILYPDVTRVHGFNSKDVMQGIIEDLQYTYIQWRLQEDDDILLRRNFGENVPRMKDLVKESDFLMLSLNPIWNFNRPVPPNIGYMGGIHQRLVKELPKDLQSYLDNSRHGVIYMSFGTNVDTRILSRDKIEIFTKVFKRLPYDVLWKWNDDTLEGKPDNVNISKWLPQSDLLRHPKVKVFITQAGLQSTDEAITAGVPLIAFPMLGDQWYNAEQYVKHKIGLKLNFEELTEEALERSIKTIIADKSYRANIQRLRLIMKDQPQPPLERAIWWIEYVLRHGGAKHLRAPSVGVGWIEYLMLDVVGFLVVSFVIIIFIIRNFVRFLFMSSTKKVKGH